MTNPPQPNDPLNPQNGSVPPQDGGSQWGQQSAEGQNPYGSSDGQQNPYGSSEPFGSPAPADQPAEASGQSYGSPYGSPAPADQPADASGGYGSSAPYGASDSTGQNGYGQAGGASPAPAFGDAGSSAPAYGGAGAAYGGSEAVGKSGGNKKGLLIGLLGCGGCAVLAAILVVILIAVGVIGGGGGGRTAPDPTPTDPTTSETPTESPTDEPTEPASDGQEGFEFRYTGNEYSAEGTTSEGAPVVIRAHSGVQEIQVGATKETPLSDSDYVLVELAVDTTPTPNGVGGWNHNFTLTLEDGTEVTAWSIGAPELRGNLVVDGDVPSGTQVAGALLFQVPKGAEPKSLTWDSAPIGESGAPTTFTF